MSATIHMLARALSPITQGEGTKGNEQLIHREPVRTPLGARLVPAVTGNSLRHRMFRDPLADHLREAWELDGELTKEQVRWLFNGGALGKDHGTRLDRVVEAERLMPGVSLLGCCMPDTPVTGRLKCGILWLVCRETVDTVKTDAPTGWWPQAERNGRTADMDALAPSESFVHRGTYYKHDATRRRIGLTPATIDAVVSDAAKGIVVTRQRAVAGLSRIAADGGEWVVLSVEQSGDAWTVLLGESPKDENGKPKKPKAAKLPYTNGESVALRDADPEYRGMPHSAASNPATNPRNHHAAGDREDGANHSPHSRSRSHAGNCQPLPPDVRPWGRMGLGRLRRSMAGRNDGRGRRSRTAANRPAVRRAGRSVARRDDGPGAARRAIAGAVRLLVCLARGFAQNGGAVVTLIGSRRMAPAQQPPLRPTIRAGTPDPSMPP